MNKIAVIGVGAWATAISILFNKTCKNVVIWSYSEDVSREINHTHTRKRLPGLVLPESLVATTNMKEATENADLIVVCMPSKYLFETVKTLQLHLTNQPILCLSKGLLDRETPFISDFFRATFPHSDYALLSGPNLASEILKQKPAAAVVSSSSNQLAETIQSCLSQDSFRVYTSEDIKGIEISGVLKNIIAIAAGCCDAMDCGNNAKAALITRGLHEITRFGVYFGAKEATFGGLSGVGDLIATCTSSNSRNYQLGFELGSGRAFDQIGVDLKNTAEGISTVKLVHKLAKKESISMPISEKIYELIFENKDPKTIVLELMSRHLKKE